MGSRELQREHLDSCINFLRQHPMYRYAHLVFICENLPGSRGGELAHLVKELYNHTVMAEYGADNRPGVNKTHSSTQNMTLRMQSALLENAIAFAENLGTFTGVPPEAAKDNLLQQMLAFRYDEILKKYTGKGEGNRDDLMVAAMMPLYWKDVFTDSSHYAEARAQANATYQHYFV